MPETAFYWVEEAMSSHEEIQARRDEMKNILRELMNHHDFEPPIHSSEYSYPRYVIDYYVVECLEKLKKFGMKPISLGGLFINDLGFKRPCLIIRLALHDISCSKEVFQEKFRIEGYNEFIAVKI